MCSSDLQEEGKLGSLLNPNFLLPHLNLLLTLLSHLHSPGPNKLILRGEGNRRARRQWNLKDLILPAKKRPIGQPSSREPVMPPSRGSERGDVQLPEPQAWLPAPMLDGEPLMDDASIRDFNGGIGCHVASVLEETLLLPRDMVEL